MTDFNQLPSNLPKPINDGAADHLLGLKLPEITLTSTDDEKINLAELKGKVVIFCYPKTGRDGVTMPEGWDQIPGARGCTPQTCSYRDNYQEIKQLGAKIFGLSTQKTDYQKELADRLNLPFSILSDEKMQLTKALSLPTFAIDDMLLLKRCAMITENAKIIALKYPVFPSNSDASWVIDYLAQIQSRLAS